ncbi:MAG: TonB-dependent receptor [Bacteroidales bacterium]|jgi:TonB-linked SusC/RagA family outer membrane protein|nr:TonB-dependent receptor [Bacteroidales bacterium]
MNKKIYGIFIALLMACFTLSGQQQQNYVIEGTVYDETGQVMPGVTVYVKDKVNLGTSTNTDGRFSIRASRGDMLVFTFVGYQNVEYLVTQEEKNLDIRFSDEAIEMDEVVVVAHGTQRRISSLAAVTSVDAKELQVPAPSLTNMLGGKVAGIITMQTSGEPGKNLAELWVRGIGTFGANSGALVLIDGLEGNINDIDPADIESFSVLKDASATAVYGVRGANGVILVTTKRGQAGRLQINFRTNWSLSQMRKLPDYLGAYDYAMLANEAYAMRGEEARYSDVQLAVIRDNLDNDLYPDVDWQKEILNKASFKQTYYASARGGGEIARYFVSLGFSNETAAYKAEKNNPYASNAGYNTYSFRTNLDINLSPTTVMYFGTDAFMSINNLPGQFDTDYIWQAQSLVTPLLYPTVYSNGQLPGAGPSESISPYVLINHTGKRTVQENKAMFTLAINQDFSFLTEGLRLRVQGAYNRNGKFNERRATTPPLYRALGRNSKGDLITQLQVPEEKIYYSRGETSFRKYHFESTLHYDRVFGTDHRVGGLVYYYISDQKDTYDASGSLSAIPVRYQGISSRLTYGFRDTYMVDFNFGFTGSENFTPGKQYGFFPSIAVGWVPSAYQWIKDQLPWLDFFKIRGSYGTVGNDRIGGSRFPYLTRVSTGTVSPWGSSDIESVSLNREGADNLIWEKAEKYDVGIDVRMFKERLSFTVDYFEDQRDGIFKERVQVPDYVGLTNMPWGNVGKMKSWGTDGNIAYTQEINKDMSFTVRANYTFSQNEVQNWERLYQEYPYQEWTGQPLDGVRGLQNMGFFKDDDDIAYSPKQNFGEVMPGDIKYKDINGDGKVDNDDMVPLSYKPNYPLMMYGAGGEFRYKNITVGFLLKGTGKTDYFSVGQQVYQGYWYTNGLGYVPFHGGETGNVLKRFNDPKNRWFTREYALANGIDPALAENPNAALPRLTYGYNENNSQVSDFWKKDARYLRLQEVTINYNLRNDFLRKIGITSVDIQLVGNNLYVWSKVKDFDPEQAHFNGRVYPIPAVYTLQLYINL